MLAGPISYLLASSAFETALATSCGKAFPSGSTARARALADIEEITAILRQRKETYRKRRPASST